MPPRICPVSGTVGEMLIVTLEDTGKSVFADDSVCVCVCIVGYYQGSVKTIKSRNLLFIQCSFSSLVGDFFWGRESKTDSGRRAFSGVAIFGSCAWKAAMEPSFDSL